MTMVWNISLLEDENGDPFSALEREGEVRCELGALVGLMHFSR